MRRPVLVPLLSLALLVATPVLAQESPAMSPEQQAAMEAFAKAGTPGPQHARMATKAGNYRMEIRSWQDPAGEPSVDSGVALRRVVLGGRVILETTEAKMGGQPFQGLGLSGFDNVSGKYWSTWNDSMGTGLMVAQGDCREAGECTFTGRWNDPVTGDEIVARMTSRWPDPDTEIFEMFAPGPDGKEMKMMQITYTRTAPAGVPAPASGG